VKFCDIIWKFISRYGKEVIPVDSKVHLTLDKYGQIHSTIEGVYENYLKPENF